MISPFIAISFARQIEAEVIGDLFRVLSVVLNCHLLRFRAADLAVMFVESITCWFSPVTAVDFVVAMDKSTELLWRLGRNLAAIIDTEQYSAM